MSFTSNLFIIFLVISLAAYYMLPLHRRWIILLAASYVFYVWAGGPAVLFLLYSTAVSFLAGRRIQAVYEREKEDRKTARLHARRVVILGMLLDFAMLAVLKYTNDVTSLINHVSGSDIPLRKWILPLGISYYTFQTTAYMLDVYWKRTTAENNPFRYALFASWFPQMAQGPIGRYGTLMPRLLEGHAFQWKNIRYGLMRMVWGLFKSMLLAGWASLYREAICSDLDGHAGIAVFIVLLYSVELYGSFSGGIDLIIGISTLFGVTLDENFRRPYFSVSIADFWRRWHITLGTWMRDYLMYPLTLSRRMGKIGKWSRKHFGKKVGLLIPMCISTIIVFLAVGLWHSASLNNIGWGLYNGFIIAVSNLLSGPYKAWKKALHVNDQSRGWKVFMIIRTFALVNIGWLFDTMSSAGDAVKVIRYSFTRFDLSQFLTIPAGRLGTGYTPVALAILGIGIGILFLVSLLQENGMHIRDTLSRYPVIIQLLLCVGMLTCTALLSPMAAPGGFIYAQF